MKFKFITAIALCAMAFISCDEGTTTIGNSLTNENDKLIVTTHDFDVLTRSLPIDSVFTRERQGYFGKVKDPETNSYVKSEFTSQFNMMESVIDELPKRDKILSRDANGDIIADSCYLMMLFDVANSYGDTLATMKLRVSELDKPINNERMHYTNFDPKEGGYIRQGGIQVDQMFSLRDLAASDSIRNLIETNLHRNTATTNDNSYYDQLTIDLNMPYTDKDGVTYNNYGTYLLRKFYEHPEYFKNSYSFVNHVCPGFHFETVDGIGVMARIMEMNLCFFYTATYGDEEDEYTDYLRMTSTDEVVQTTKVTNDKEAISHLAEDNSCTYLKTPSGIFTEVILPVDEICTSHPTDSLLTAKIAFLRQNNETSASKLAFEVPKKLMLIEKDSLESFFKKTELFNNEYAYQVTLEKNAYTFSNISNLITRMHHAKENGMKSDPNWIAKHLDWNKALLVPVEVISIKSTSTSLYYGTQTYETPISTENKLGLTSTKLIKGTVDQPIKINVIYAKFKD